MIKSISIHQFRSCRSTEIRDLRELTALVGRNGAGKTTVLRAIRWVAEVAIHSFGSNSEERDVAVEIELDDCEFSIRIAQEETREGLIPRERIECRPRFGESFQVDRDGHKFSFGADDSPDGFTISPEMSTLDFISKVGLPIGENSLAKLRSFLGSIRYYGVDEPQFVEPPSIELFTESRYADWRSEESIHNRDSAISLKLISLKEDREEEFTELRHVLGENGLGLLERIVVRYTKAYNEVPAFYSVWYFLPNQETPVQYFALSTGTRRVINLVTSLIYDRSTVVLLEHPEDSVHDGLLGKLVGYLRSIVSPTQLILTSHSSTVLNAFDAEHIRLVLFDETGTTVRSLSETEIQAACNFMTAEGTLSDFLDSVQE